MRKLTLLLTVAVLTSGMVACSDKSTDTPTTLEVTELPTIDMVATHDIKLDISVTQLTFVPNSVTPWLGRIILLDDAGHIYSTDIEGREPKPVGSGIYIDVFGLARENEAGVFLAITENNKIEAFIESDDQGNFSPMIYSGTEIAIQAFCPQYGTEGNQITVFTADGKHKTLGLDIASKNVLQEISDAIIFPNQPPSCLSQYATIGQKQSKYNVVTSKLSGLYIYQTTPADSKYNVTINNGLSVGGVEHAKYVASTHSNYGGGAYANGVLALVDKDEQRIVFISMSYAERQLLKAVNPAEDLHQ